MTTATKQTSSTNPGTEDLPTHPCSPFTLEATRQQSAYARWKRTMDILGAALALCLLSPVFVIASLLVAVSSPGPVLFRQKRVGKHGREFICLKFRTMVSDAELRKDQLAEQSHHDDPRTFKIKRDPRITRVGHWLRRSSIDELPQLINVLNGEMSLVGPRPPVPAEAKLYSEHDMRRLTVKPGLTCIWQVSGRADIPFDQQVAMDIEYIEQQSLWLDVKLVCRTLPALLSGRGAY